MFLVNRAVQKLKRDGVLSLVSRAPEWIFDRKIRRYYIQLRSDDTFSFDGGQYQYFNHAYNVTWKNPRAVEIPITWREIQSQNPERLLEVGNVLSHYFDTDHVVLDKYETSGGVINKDVVEFSPEFSPDFIACISTLEHIGYDSGEQTEEPEKLIEAVERMKSWLSEGGTLLVTVPYDYNPHLDRFLAEDQFGFTEKRHLCRTSKWNEWEECTWDSVQETTWGEPYPYANGLTVAWFEK